MPIRPIVKFGDPVLHAPAAPVDRIDDEIRSLFDDMIETMYAAPGIGLAAPQIGVPLRVIVIDLSVGEDPTQVIRLVNPEFVEREGEQKHEEGCLSVPGYAGSPTRPERVVVRGLDPEGRERVYTATELLARAFCHEIDHIDGLALRGPPLPAEARPHEAQAAQARPGRLGGGVAACASSSSAAAASRSPASRPCSTPATTCPRSSPSPTARAAAARRSLPRRSSRWPSERGIRVLQPRRVREPEAQEALRSLEPELQVVVAFGQILPRAVIDIAPRGTVNVHASLLPKLRGAAPIQWAIATGEAETGVTTMLIDEGLDTGPLLLARSTPIGPDETAAELEPRLARLGAEVLLETVRGLAGRHAPAGAAGRGPRDASPRS